MEPAATFLHTPVLDLKWPNATVPYVFHHNMRDSDRKQTVKAMKEFHKHSCIKFIEWTGEPDYIVIEYSIRGECSSHVGRQGGPQPLYLSPRYARSVGVAMQLHT
ncbi:bone morphogenetic protein 1-like [Macrosteles quadrilineatus]|uniref:bone morphogenetic protein 1-like n=1 Tax=Macrosteles quadrilineatus TaxID=74068 RepID=UPI0023E11339|nr:bone morphogenetic protein 1-like [Macrosteles quadrilineatus]